MVAIVDDVNDNDDDDGDDKNDENCLTVIVLDDDFVDVVSTNEDEPLLECDRKSDNNCKGAVECNTEGNIDDGDDEEVGDVDSDGDEDDVFDRKDGAGVTNGDNDVVASDDDDDNDGEVNDDKDDDDDDNDEIETNGSVDFGDEECII